DNSANDEGSDTEATEERNSGTNEAADDGNEGGEKGESDKGEDNKEKDGEKGKGEDEKKEKDEKKKDEEGEGKKEDGDKKDASKDAPDGKAPEGKSASDEEKTRAAELATARAQSRRGQVSGVPEAASAPTQNDRGERMAPSAASQERQAREQSAEARGESRGGKIAEARAKLGAAKEAYKGFNAMIDELRKLGDIFRSRLDQTFLSSIFAFPLGTLFAAFLLHARVLACAPGIRKSRFGFFRFTAKNVFEMLPNAKKMRPFTFTPWTGLMAAGIIDSGIAVGLLINFIITFFPYIVAAIGIGFIFDADMRELLLSLAGF
ncbi:MAG: hypothetical protein AAB570_00010, partial [Patescibacteria group bacterium]